MITGLPPSRVAIADTAPPTREWYSFFQSLQVNLNSDGLQQEVDAVKVRVTALEHQSGDSESLTIQGSGSIYVTPAGIRIISLQGDVSAPDPSFYYGTDANGAKGWFSSASLLAGATTDDLPEGTTHTYFHDAPADGGLYARKDHAWSPVVGTAGGTVTNIATGAGLTGGPITGAGTVALDAASIAALALADMSVQSVTQGSGIAVDNTDPTRPVVSFTGGVPYFVADGSTYSVPIGIQALWTVPIELEGTADLDVSGYLVEVN